MEEYARVRLSNAIPEAGLEAGAVGAIVIVHEPGRAYEVEFTDGEGRTVALLALLEEQIEEVKAGA